MIVVKTEDVVVLLLELQQTHRNEEKVRKTGKKEGILLVET